VCWESEAPFALNTVKTGAQFPLPYVHAWVKLEVEIPVYVVPSPQSKLQCVAWLKVPVNVTGPGATA
jgi:hypothetical protein